MHGDRAAVAAELGLHYFVLRSASLDIKEELGFVRRQTDKEHKEFVMRNGVIHYREVGQALAFD